MESKQCKTLNLSSLPDVFAVATDTIWGMACSADNKDAVEKIYTLKKRDPRKPLVLMTSHIDAARSLIHIPDKLLPWLSMQWPGALTLVSRAVSLQYSHCHQDTPMLGVRIPAHSRLLELLASLKYPLAVTSLNHSGEPPITDKSKIPHLFQGELNHIFGELSPNASPSAVLLLKENQLVPLRAEKEQLDALAQNLPTPYTISTP
jgi:L-threonylcarbamoyladenylate synthase